MSLSLAHVLRWPIVWDNNQCSLIIDFTDVGSFDFDSGDGYGKGDPSDGWGGGYGDTPWSDDGDGFSPGAFRHTGNGHGSGMGDMQAILHPDDDYV